MRIFDATSLDTHIVVIAYFSLITDGAFLC